MARRKAQLIEGRTQHERAKRRRQQGRLSDLQIAPLTLTRYEKATTELMQYWSQDDSPLPNSPEEADEMLSEYIEFCWERGLPRLAAADAICGLQHFVPQLRRALRGSWRLLGTWDRNEIPSRAPPLLPEQALGMAGFACLMGRPEVGAALIVGFNAFLRPCEMLFTAADCIFEPSCERCVVNLGLTKSGKRVGAPEQVIIDDPLAVVLLRKVFDTRSSHTPLLNKGLIEFRAIFTTLATRVGASSSGLKPYSIRRGGATHHYVSKGRLDQTIERGRWAIKRTAKIYIQDGVALTRDIQLTRTARNLLALGQSHLHDYLDQVIKKMRGGRSR